MPDDQRVSISSRSQAKDPTNPAIVVESSWEKTNIDFDLKEVQRVYVTVLQGKFNAVHALCG